MVAAFAYDVFLSHSSKDAVAARRLAAKLKSDGLRVWFDEWEIAPGDPFMREIKRGVANSRVLIVLASAHWIESEWGPAEAEMSFFISAGRRLIPVRIDAHPLDPLLLSRSFVDWSDESETEYAKLLDSCREPAKPVPVIRESGLDEVQSWGWTGETLMTELLALDQATLEGLTEEFNGTPKQWGPIVEDHPDTWRIFVNEQREIVGNWHFAAVFDSEYARARAGLLLESELTADKVCALDEPGWYKIYFLAIFLLPDYRRQYENQLQLRRSLLRHLVLLARRGIFVETMCANAYSDAGEVLCKRSGFSELAKHYMHGTIYEGVVYPPPKGRTLPEYSELERLYRDAIALRA